MKAKKITAMLAAAGMILTALFPATKTEAGAVGQEASLQAAQESSTGKFSVNGTVLVGYKGEDEDLVIPEGIEEIGRNVFGRAEHLKRITLPKSLKKIRAFTFSGCTGLERIVLPEGIEEIEEYAFYDCSSLADIQFPEKKTCLIGERAFQNTAWQEKAHQEAEAKSERFVIREGILLELAIDNPGSEVVIPEGVVNIEAGVFQGTEIKSAVLPDSLRVIGNRVFGECKRLESVQMPSRLERMGTEVFMDCVKLQKAVVPQGITVLAEGVFRNCANLRQVPLPDGLQEIGENVFRGCKKLEGIELPGSLEKIGYAAFSNCRRLEAVVIPEGVTTIGSYAFWSCLHLADIQLPSTIVEGGDGKTYYRTPWLEKRMAEQTKEQPFLILGNTLVQARLDVTGKTVIPDTVTKIAAYSFEEAQYCEVEIPESVTEIGNCAFYQCKNLERLYVPDSVTVFGEMVFSYCPVLKDVRMSDSVTALRRFCYHCPKLEEIELPENLEALAIGFDNCPNLKKVITHSKLSRIYSLVSVPVADNVSKEFVLYVDRGSFAEAYVNKWKNTEWARMAWAYNGEEEPEKTDPSDKNKEEPEKEKPGNTAGKNDPKDFEIQDGVLVKYHGNDPDVMIPEGVTRIGKAAFWDGAVPGSLRSVVIPEGIEEIGERAFSRCEYLEEISFPNSLRKIEKDAFSGCIGLKELKLPEGLEEIGNYAFGGCTSLKAVELPESLQKIDAYGFFYCPSLREITIPGGIRSIGEEAFSGCKRLAKVAISQEATGLMGSDIFSETQWLTDMLGEQPDETPFVILNGTIVAVREEDMGEGVVVPEGVTAISAKAFSRTQLASITLPESLEEIGEGAFRECLDLEQVTCLGSLKTIGKQAFSSCPKLTRLEVPEGITRLEEATFQNCTALQQITLPQSLKEIGDNVFRGCKKLKDVVLPGNLEKIGYAAFSNCQSLQHMVIPEGATSVGSYAFWNCQKLADIELPDTLTDGGDGKTYYRTPWLEQTLAGQPEERPFLVIHDVLIDAREDVSGKAEIPEGITAVAAYAMADTAFTEISLPDTVTAIGAYAFANCAKLKRLQMEDSVQEIGKRAFYFCTALKELELSDAVTYLEDAFYGCRKLKELELPEQLEELQIGLHECPAMKKLIVHGKLKRAYCLIWSEKDVSKQFVCYVEKGSYAEKYVRSRMPYAYNGKGDVIYYKIKEGDTLKSIAKTFLGKETRDTELMKKNKLTKKSLKGKTGKTLLIPIE